MAPDDVDVVLQVHEEEEQDAPVERIYALDLAGVGERLGLSEQELLAGMAKHTDAVPLTQLLGGASHSSLASLCRQACVMVTAVHSGADVLEKSLRGLTRPIAIEHVVLTLPNALSVAQQAEMTRIAHKVCTARRIRVDVVAAQDEGSAVRESCRLFREHRGALTASAGVLFVACEQLFDAATFRMMLTGAETASEASQKLVRALVQLSDAVDERSEAATSFAGLFACSDACVSELERLCDSSFSSGSDCCSLTEALAEGSRTAAFSVKQVVASDYCAWTPCSQGSSSSYDVSERGDSEHPGSVGYSAFRLRCGSPQSDEEQGELCPLLPRGGDDACGRVDAKVALGLMRAYANAQRAAQRRVFLLQSALQPSGACDSSSSTTGKDFLLAFEGHELSSSAQTSRLGHSLLRLPSAAAQVHLEVQTSALVHDADSSPRLQLQTAKCVPVLGYLLLAVALGATTTQRWQALTHGQLQRKSPLLVLLWRLLGAAVALAALAAPSCRGLSGLVGRTRALFLVCALSFTAWHAALVGATSLGAGTGAPLFSISQPLLLVALRGRRLSPQLLGVLLASAGAVPTLLSSGDDALVSESHVAARELLALVGAVAGVCFLETASRLRARMRVCVLAFALVATAVALVLLLLVALRQFGDPGVSQLHAAATAEPLVSTAALAIETLTLLASLTYMEPVAVSVASVAAPVVAAVLSGPQWRVDVVLGAAATLLGSGLVLGATHRSETTTDVSSALVGVPLPPQPQADAGDDGDKTSTAVPHHMHGRRRHSLLACCGAASSRSSSQLRVGFNYGYGYGSCASVSASASAI